MIYMDIFYTCMVCRAQLQRNVILYIKNDQLNTPQKWFLYTNGKQMYIEEMKKCSASSVHVNRRTQLYIIPNIFGKRYLYLIEKFAN